ncbi:MAG: response regulator [Lutibacter sp.]|nr:response regulator [Lutibacter sp.]
MTNETRNLTILLVEDNPVDVDLTLRALKKQKSNTIIVVARDGEQALEQMELWDQGAPVPMVILLDLKLPKVDGHQVLKTLKSHPVYKTIPVVVLTSSGDDRDISKAYEFGANSYIVKPVSFDKFIEVAAQIELYWTGLNKANIN